MPLMRSWHTVAGSSPCGALVYAIGRKEVAECRELNIDLKELRGSPVVCATDGEVSPSTATAISAGSGLGYAAGAIENRRLPWRPLANRFRVKMLSKVAAGAWW